MRGLFHGTCTLLCSPSAVTSGCLPTGPTPIDSRVHRQCSLIPASSYPEMHTLHVTVEEALVATVDAIEQNGSLANFWIFSFRQLSRHLVGLWTAENPIAMNLLKRILVRIRSCSV